MIILIIFVILCNKTKTKPNNIDFQNLKPNKIKYQFSYLIWFDFLIIIMNNPIHNCMHIIAHVSPECKNNTFKIKNIRIVFQKKQIHVHQQLLISILVGSVYKISNFDKLSSIILLNISIHKILVYIYICLAPHNE